MSKGLKEPGDKLQLIKVLSLAQVIDALEAKTRSQQTERKSEVDEGEESYREALGRLLNVLGLELRALIDVSARPISFLSFHSLILLQDTPNNDEITSEASTILTQILPVVLRFMEDEYDDTCATIFPLLQSILGSVSLSILLLWIWSNRESVQTC